MITRFAVHGLRLLARRRKSVASEDISSLTLVELTGLGDVISLLPAVQGFHSLFPSASLGLVVDNAFVELLLSLRLPATVHGVAGSRTPSGVMAAVQLVRKTRPTLTCSMSPPRRNALVALASGAPAIAGYLTYTDSLAPYLLETPVEIYGLPSRAETKFGRGHISERALLVCRALGLADDVPELRLDIAEETLTRLRGKLRHAGLLPTGEYVVIHPFAGWKFREWPLQAYASLAERMLESEGKSVVFLWEEKKEGNLPWLRHHFGGKSSVVFASRLSLLESAVLVTGASLFIGNDSGPLHLAAMLGVRALGLFGPSDPTLTAPRSRSSASWLYPRVDCSPCDQRKCIRPADPCMQMISIAEVAQAAASLLRRPAHA